MDAKFLSTFSLWKFCFFLSASNFSLGEGTIFPFSWGRGVPDRKMTVTELIQVDRNRLNRLHSGYGSYDNYEYLSTHEKTGYIPDHYFEKIKHGEYQRDENKYHKEDFCYDEQRDVCIRPEGKDLPFYKERDSDEGVVSRKQWIYKGNECISCSVVAQCTKVKYRTIAREKREPLQEEMRRRLLSEEVREECKKRVYWVGPILGHLKHNLGLKSFF